MATPAVVIRAEDGSSVRVESFPLILGRSVEGSPLQPDCDLASLDSEGRISRQHAAVDWQDGRMVVTDLGSTNGTVLDGRTLTPHQPTPLPPRSDLVLGQVALVLEVEAPEPVAAAAKETSTMVDQPPQQRRAAAASGGPAHAAQAQPAAGRGQGGGAAGRSGSGRAGGAVQAPAGAAHAPAAQAHAPAAQAHSPAAQAAAAPGAVASPAAAPNQAALAAFVDSVFRAFQDPGVSRLVLEPRRKLRLRRDGDWVQAGDVEVSREAWMAFWTAFCRSAHVDPNSSGYVSVLLGDGVLAEAFLPPLSVTPVFMAEKRPPPLGLDGMVAEGLIEVSTVGTLRQLLRSHNGMLLVGPARSGRTSFLEGLVDSIPRGERVAIVERRPTLRVASPEAVRLRSAQGLGEPAIGVAMLANPDWIVVDDADPGAAAAVAWRHSVGGPSALMTARTTDLAAWKARAAETLTLAGSPERAAAIVDATFPVTIRLAPGPDRFVVQGVDKPSSRRGGGA